MKIPFDHSFIECEIPGASVITSNIDQLTSDRPGLEIVREAMENPIGSAHLYELAKGVNNCVIIISDHTRPVPSKDILPNMLRELRQGNPDIDITLLVATGFHRLTTDEELIAKVGEEIFKNEKIVVHNAHDPSTNVQIGYMASGAPLIIDRIAAEAELLVSEGFIEPHFFAGFSGGRKSIVPGISDAATVLGNHCGEFIASDYARTGVLDGNPIHRDMLSAALQAQLAYVVNVVIDEEHKTVAAFAGNVNRAHRAGAAFLSQYCQVKPIPADIVITSNGGAPLDQNIYQCVKGMTAAEASANEGAVIIMCAGIADGTGGEGFYLSLKNCESVAKLYEEYGNTPQDKTVDDQWESQVLCRVLMKHKVIFVSTPDKKDIITDMKMDYAESLEEALAMAKAIKGEDASITVIPNGISVIVKE